MKRNEKGEQSTAFELAEGQTLADLIMQKLQPEKTCLTLDLLSQSL